MIKMIRYNLEEASSKKDLDQWKKESLMWTKNIMRVKNGQDIKNLLKAARIWSSEFQDWVEEEVLGSNKRRRELSAPIPKDLTEDLWSNFFNFTTFVNSYLFNVFNTPRKFKSLNQYYFIQNHGLPEYSSEDKYTSEMWQEIYEAYVPMKNYTYARYQRLAKNAFRSLENFFDEMEDLGVSQLPSARARDRFKLLGINVEVHDSEQSPSKFLKDIKPFLEPGIQTLFKFGFRRYLQSLSILIDLNDKDPAVGKWLEGQKRIVIFERAFYKKGEVPYALYHEFGHMYFDSVLSKDQIDIWNEFRYAKENQLVITERDKEEIKRALVDLDYFREENKSQIRKRRILQNHLVSHILDIKLKIKVIALLAGNLLGGFTDIDSLVGISIWSGIVTQYSLSRGEDFPEVFAQFLSGKPIPDVVERVLRLIVPELKSRK